MHRPSDLRQFLTSLGVAPQKRLSQNFLIDKNILNKIVALAEVGVGDRVLEIGAGPGALTEALLAKEAQVTAVEKDRAFAAALSRFPQVEVFTGDIRDFPINTFPPKGKVVANIPYQLTSTILELFLPRHDLFTTLTLMVQEEVARRLTARPRTKDYSALTVFANFYAHVTYGFFVTRRCFYPPPKVDSAVVLFHLKKPPLSQEEDFLKFVHTAFANRRKMLRGNLTSYGSSESIMGALKECGISETARAEELTINDFLSLYKELTL